MATDRSGLVQPLTALEASVRARSDTDTQFINWWVYVLLLSWLTFGIAQIYYFIRRVSRVDQYSRRKQDYFESVVAFTDRYAQGSLQRQRAEPIIRDMRALVEEAKQHDLRPIGALKSFLLTVVTFGIYGIFVWYQLNRAWADRQRVTAAFTELLTKAWMVLGITNYPITFQPASGKQRNFWLYVVLSVVTFGIWGLVWDYKVHTDPNNIYPRIHQVEDTVVQLARAA
jgi:hypothetical protein